MVIFVNVFLQTRLKTNDLNSLSSYIKLWYINEGISTFFPAPMLGKRAAYHNDKNIALSHLSSNYVWHKHMDHVCLCCVLLYC